MRHLREPNAPPAFAFPLPLVDRLMTLAGELVLTRNQALRSIDGGAAAMRPVLQKLDAVTSELQGAVTQTRMQPVGNLFAKFPRLVRDLARQLNKQIELEMSGTEVELDKSVLEQLSDPLTHLVRNACDHGIETPAERQRAGKPPTRQNLACAPVKSAGRFASKFATTAGGWIRSGSKTKQSRRDSARRRNLPD